MWPLFIHPSIHSLYNYPSISIYTVYTQPCISTHISVGAAVIYFELIPGVPVVEFVWWKFPITLREVGRQNRTDAREEQLEPHEAASHHIHLSHIHRSPAQETNTHRPSHLCSLSQWSLTMLTAFVCNLSPDKSTTTVHLIDCSFISQRLCLKN